MARELYNFIWVPYQVERVIPAQGVALQTEVTISENHADPWGVIVFPAFLTPLIHVSGGEGSEWLELIIATRSELTPDTVNYQLKISPELSSLKQYSPSPLFVSATGNIVVDFLGEVSDDGATILETHSKFAGILHPSYARSLYGFYLDKLYKVKIKSSALSEGLCSGIGLCCVLEEKFTAYQLDGTRVRRVKDYANVGRELGDAMIRSMLDRRFGVDNSSNQNSIPGRGRYAFPIKGNTISMAEVDPSRPIQSYHPLIVLSGADAARPLNLGHVSDIHVNSRWQILGRSPARVIEYGDGQYEDESPKIGKLVAENNRSFHDVLSRLFGGEADAVIVGGDVVDHIRNAYDAARILSPKNTPRQIWDAMNLEGDAYTPSTYPVGLDLVAFYSFIFDAMVRHKKPVFAITGNHDCYVDAFGISPRLNVEATASRTNEGIPADLNLTFYEALLAFGPSGGQLRSASSSFEEEWFEWFHLVLTPFNDWWVKFPKQSLVGLGWGNSEDLIDSRGGQSGGHLPRSDDAISDAQLALLQRAVDGRATRPVTLTTHFTFLSYLETVAMHPSGARSSPGTFRLNDNTLGTENYSRFEMGTFEANRETLITMLAERQIQCVVTGHSHRRGLYQLGTRSGDIIPAELFDTDPNNPLSVCGSPAHAITEPAIIVSDSAGPYPRYNRDGEFGGWGSDRPGGTLIKFNASTGPQGKPTARISEVRAVTAMGRPKPRGAVAVDFVDVSTEAAFNNNRMETRGVTGDQDSGAAPPSPVPIWYIHANLTPRMHSDWQMYIEKIIFAGRHLDKWIRVETRYNATMNAFEVPVAQTDAFRIWLRNVFQPTRYVSIKMGSNNPFIKARYDWDSHWNFEVRTEAFFWFAYGANGKMVRHVSYRIMRPQREIEINGRNILWREVPNFDWRMANDPKYAAP